MGKKICSFILILALCFQMVSVCVFAAEDQGSPKHIPRVVSIVFDDSGSMYKNSDRWAYTSYAMQSFAAMMGSDDILYITYLNAPVGTQKVDLSNGAKHKTVSDFSKIMFGGGTPDRVQKAADCLEREYANYKSNAKYYLVVMSDGELDSGLGLLSDSISAASAKTAAKLSGADFETIYFSMKKDDNTTIPGVASHFASTSDEITDALKDVSADIMGRTEVSHSVSSGKLSFTLQYPALSIAVFAQKQNGNFDNFKAVVQKDGKNLSCQVGNYPIKCPTTIVKNLNSSVYQEKIPENPPSGVVSLITNGGNSLPKGNYTVDVSGCDLQTKDVVVLVEPAVRIGCKYRLNDDDDTITFEELKERVCEGDTVTVECGLYELNSDGSLGDAVPLDILSPEYKIMVNGKQVGNKVSGKTNVYQFQVDKTYENQEMRVEASLKGYQPFVMKETFGELNIGIQAVPLPDGKAEIALTKPLWKKWFAGENVVSFELEKADPTVLTRTSIQVEGCDGLPEGICSAMEGAARLEGNTIVYSPRESISFDQLPESFSVSLVALDTGEVVVKKTVKVIRPAYRFEAKNELAESLLSLTQLKNNSSGIEFTLMVDYDGSGQYIPVSQSDCEDEIKVALSSGVLPGESTEGNGTVRFVPQYDRTVNTDLPLSQIIGKEHRLFATATVGGQEIKSEEVVLSVSSAAYRLEVENQITQPLSLDTVKTNQQKIIFRLLADYEGSGSFSQLADWDGDAIEKIEIVSGDLPGRIEIAYDAGGNSVGKAFIPVYDENNNNGIPFTKVAGKVHQITGSVRGTDLSVGTAVEVLAPDYEIVVRKDGIQLTDVELRGNQVGVEFTVLRDGRALTAKELEGLAPYDLAFDKDQPWMKIVSEVREAEDGTAYLLCMPQYDGWSFPAAWCWNWLTLFTVAKGEMHMTLTLGKDVGSAAISVGTSELAWIIFLIVLAVMLLIGWICFCCATRVRFLRGSFYTVSFKKKNKSTGYVVQTCCPSNANKNSILRFLLSGKFLIPFSEQTAVKIVGTKSAMFAAKKSPMKTFSCHSFPFSVGEQNKLNFNKGHLSTVSIRKIINKDHDFVIDGDALKGSPCSDEDKKIEGGSFLVEKGTHNIIFFLTRNEEKSMKQRRKSTRTESLAKPSRRKNPSGRAKRKLSIRNKF